MGRSMNHKIFVVENNREVGREKSNKQLCNAALTNLRGGEYCFPVSDRPPECRFACIGRRCAQKQQFAMKQQHQFNAAELLVGRGRGIRASFCCGKHSNQSGCEKENHQVQPAQSDVKRAL